LPGSPGTVQHTIAYADIALKKFFQIASTKPWFKNTVFVITGDHTSHSDKEYFYSQSGHYEVPFLIYAPGIDIKHINEKLSGREAIINDATQKTLSQCDIIPTLWNLLGANNPRLGFGRSAFDPSYKGYSTHIDKDLYYIIQYPFVLALNQQGDVVDYHKQLRNNNKAQKLPLEGPQFEWLRAKLQCQMSEYSQRIKQNRWE
jgi:phosphoglycerol transferase MdoB-like AlkP superfamily enzyme